MSVLVRRLFPALFLSHLIVASAVADQALDQGDALTLLQRIATAARELNFRGAFVYQHGEQAESSRITHMVERGAEYEKLETLDGPRREVIRTNSEIITFYAEKNEVKRERRTARKLFPALLPEQLGVLTEFYKLSKGGQERIAGHMAQELILAPKDEYRYGHRLWAEVQSGLLLKAKMVRDNAQVMEQFHFTDVQINVPFSREAVKPSFPLPPGVATGDLNAPPAVDTGWVVRSQPAGFRKIMEMLRVKQSGGQVVHLVFSDGLAAVSVFIEPMPTSRTIVPGLSHQGAVSIYTRPMSDQLVTVLGETPPVTVMQIANSVTPKSR